jgi:hypothetical protein
MICIAFLLVHTSPAVLSGWGMNVNRAAADRLEVSEAIYAR